MASNWSKLPADLVATIALKLESIEDFIYFSAVCRSWNRARSSIKHLWRSTQGVPWLLLAENTHDNPDHVRKIFNPSNGKTYHFNLPDTFGGRCWGSAYGWVAVAKLDRTVQLYNPITKALINFPSFDILLDLRDPVSQQIGNYSCWYFEGFLKKLIVLKVPSQKTGQEDEFAIMVSYDEGLCLAFARQGDASWTSVWINEETEETSEEEEPFVGIFDIIAVDDHVCILYEDDSSRYALAYWNVKELISGVDLIKPTKKYSPSTCEIPRKSHRFGQTAYLIQSGSDLLLALRHIDYIPDPLTHRVVNYETKDFGVYRLNVEDNKWDRIEELGDKVLFVGDNSSMAVSVARDKCLQPNCIYYTDDQAENWNMLKLEDKNGGHDMGVVDIKSKERSLVYEGSDTRSTFCTPIWFIPQV